MKFRKFAIQNYRAIVGPVTIDLFKSRLIPIIGINECGKTTILHAIFAFDYYNDELNEDGRHLRDIANLYATSSPPATITAEIEIDQDEISDALKAVQSEQDDHIDRLERHYQKEIAATANNPAKAAQLGTERDRRIAKAKRIVSTARGYYRRRTAIPSILRITRNLGTKRYLIEDDSLRDEAANHELAREIIKQLPYILFFDDFRDSIDDKIEILEPEEGGPTGWLAILEQLFKQTDKNFSVFKLGDLEERQRKSVIAKVTKALNETLTREWQNFRLDDREVLRIGIEYEGDSSLKDDDARQYLKLEVVETVANGDDYYFSIQDRSKGFYWFFNFVMKLEFNPKVIDSSDTNAIYLLDEPGSYLHASAQSRLCAKLKQLSQRNHVVYCTHSHYLLDPEVIPISNIRIAEKGNDGRVTLIPINEHKGSITEKRTAYQPVFDALQVKPFMFDFDAAKVAVIVEGITDFYSIELFKGLRSISVLPSVGADSIVYYISFMIACGIDFRALWDNDEQGKKARNRAIEHFGEEIATSRFFLLPLRGLARKAILQDLFDPSDIARIKAELGLPKATRFEKVIATLFYSDRKVTITSALEGNTKSTFVAMFEAIEL